MAEETVYLKNKKIRVFCIDRLLEGEAPVSKDAILYIHLTLDSL